MFGIKVKFLIILQTLCLHHFISEYRILFQCVHFVLLPMRTYCIVGVRTYCIVLFLLSFLFILLSKKVSNQN